MTMWRFFRNGRTEAFEHVWPAGRGVPGWVLEHKTAYLTNTPDTDPQVQHELPVHQGIRSILCVPIINSVNVVLGCLNVSNKNRHEGFTLEDQKKLLSLAPVASIAIQNALAFQQRLTDLSELEEAAEQLRALAANLESAREQERIRIARDLHDELGQALTAMRFNLAWLTGRLAGTDADLSDKAKRLSEQMGQLIKTVRRISTELRPGMLDDLGLPASLEWVARDFEKNTGIGCTLVAVDNSAQDQLSAPVALAVYRIFQEALTNVARHSGARNVTVNMTANPNELSLAIQDDGRGISDGEVTGRKTLGLLGMRERAQRLGGSVNFSGSHDGTLVSVIFPMDKEYVENPAC